MLITIIEIFIACMNICFKEGMMFRMKAKKMGMEMIKDSLAFGSGFMAGRISEGMKYAGNQIIHMRDYVRKSDLTKNLQKNPSAGVLAIAGLSLAVFGLFSLMRK